MLEITCRYVVLHLNLKRLGFKGETVTGRRRQSHVNVIHVRMSSNPFTHHATSNRIKTQNANTKLPMRTLKTQRDVHKMFPSQ